MLVTGAANGVGRVIARALALYDLELVLADCDGAPLAELGEELCAHNLFCDAQSKASIEIFAALIEQRFDSLHAIVNAAETAESRTVATVFVTSALLPLMKQTAGRRLILNVAPELGDSSNSFFSYAASAEATVRYSDHLRSSFKGMSVTVGTILPEPDAPPGAYDELIRPLIGEVIRGFDAGAGARFRGLPAGRVRQGPEPHSRSLSRADPPLVGRTCTQPRLYRRG